MDKKSKVLLWILGLLIVGSVAVTYWKIMIKKDYIIEAQADCDPTVEKCFVYHCDPTTETCTGDDEEDTSYYKLIQRNAANIPLCDPEDETCQALVCPEGEKDCAISLCDKETVGADEECSDPEEYNANHPADDEEEICEDGDGECAAAVAADENVSAGDEDAATDEAITDDSDVSVEE